jgi:hypothetical protein
MWCMMSLSNAVNSTLTVTAKYCNDGKTFTPLREIQSVLKQSPQHVCVSFRLLQPRR